MSNFQIKTKILKISGQDFHVPRNFELVHIVSKYPGSIIAEDKQSKKKIYIEKICFVELNLIESQLELASLLAHFYLGSSTTVKFHHLILPQNFQKSKCAFKIVDYMESDLNSIIKSNQILTPNHVRYFLYQILLHLHHLHSHNLCLFYFSPKLFLLNSDCELKLSKYLYEYTLNCNRIYQKQEYVDNRFIQRWYLPPEYFYQNEFTLKSDMWGLGCIFYELVTRKPLFPGSDMINMLKIQIEGLGKLDQSEIELIKNKFIRERIINIEFKMNNLFDRIKGLCEDGLFILKNLLVFNPEKRMSALECLMHPYFEEFFVEEDLFVEVKSFERVFDALFMKEDEILWRVGELARELEGHNELF